MTASCGPRRAPRRRPFSSWSHFVGNLLVTLALRLPASTDACDKIPRYNSMKAKGNPVPPVSAGFAAEYECRPGYRLIVPLVRPTTTVCQPDGTWAPPLREACTRKSCPQLAEPINGRLDGTFQYGAQANYSCNVGYTLVGAPVLRCELARDGNNVAWSGDPPQCEKILCQPPQKILNGEFSNSHKDTFEYNDVVTYSCKPSGGPDEYSLVGESKLICSGPNKWSSDPPECKVVRCDYPSLPDGELVSGFQKKYYYKAEVEFKCNQGYSLEGSRKIVCEANSTWVPEIPRCVSSSPRRPTPNKTPFQSLGTGAIVLAVVMSWDSLSPPGCTIRRRGKGCRKTDGG
ncbi:membrane cofactor protein-like [Myotis myotis]|uniref:membrane cofactor protein-like n=1 Tax=Myotis myotis TaxID=51298 RepID=UPI00174AF6A8|nr:membrane cofactor protein-like [Myotis myotis]